MPPDCCNRSPSNPATCLHGSAIILRRRVKGALAMRSNGTLLTGNLTGNFSNLGLFLRFLLLINEQIQMLASKFPSKWNREFF